MEFVKFESIDRIKKALNKNIRENYTENLNIALEIRFSLREMIKKSGMAQGKSWI